jgi:hypothetical protein
MVASVQELVQAYQRSLERNDPDVEVFRRALMERLVMLCDCVTDRAGAR